MSPFLCISKTTFVNPIKSSGFGLSPSFSATAMTWPPTLLKKPAALVPIKAKQESMPCSFSSADLAITCLNKLMFKPPHNPLSDETTIKHAFFGVLSS